MRDSEGQSKGFGFVCFLKREDAVNASKQASQINFNGRRLVVNFAERKEIRKAKQEGYHDKLHYENYLR